MHKTFRTATLCDNRKSKTCTAFDKLRPRACRGELSRSIENLKFVLLVGALLFALSVPVQVQQLTKIPWIGIFRIPM